MFARNIEKGIEKFMTNMQEKGDDVGKSLYSLFLETFNVCI